MMENRISYDDERKLTNAIESAATLASNDPSRDVNEVLSGQLKQAGVDARFAKVASSAFNKRLTVLTFKKTADDHKADPFDLADADKVTELMTGESLEKAASVEAPFEIKVTDAPTMQKAASAEKPSRALFEDTIQWETLVRHVEGIMEKNAAALSHRMSDLTEVQDKAESLATDLAEYFMKNASASFEFDTLVNAFGDRWKNAIGHKLPETTEYTKTAGGAILSDSPIYKKATELVESHETADLLKKALAYYGEGLGQFCKAAAFVGDIVQKMEMGLEKKAAPNVGGIIGEYGTDMTNLGGGALSSGISTADSLVRNVSNTAGNALLNAYSLYQAGNAAHMAPNEVLDAEFLTKDRYRDRLLGWSDMTADPQFSMYPAEQVFLATQKAMDMDTTLERPDRRELLRAYVAQLLAQNNRMSTADMAALAQTLYSLSRDDSHGAQQQAVESVKQIDEKRAPELPALRPMIEGLKDIQGGWTQALADVDKSLKDYADANAARIKDEKAQEEKEKDKADKTKAEEAKKLEDAAKEKERQRIAAQNARIKFLHDVLQIQMRRNPSTGEIRYIQNTGRNNTPRTYTQAEIDTILTNAQSANLIPALPA